MKLTLKNNKEINAPVIREFFGIIILAQSEEDYLSKVNKAKDGDIIGFYRKEEVGLIEN